MTGKDWIIYILNNNLEDEDLEYILTQTFFTKEKVAIKLGVGVETVKTMFKFGVLPGIKINNEIYIYGDYEKQMRGDDEKN